MTFDLKQCPFCGSEADIRMGDRCLWVECKKCGCRTNTYSARNSYGESSLIDTLDKVQRKWNDRVHE